MAYKYATKLADRGRNRFEVPVDLSGACLRAWIMSHYVDAINS